MDLLHHYLQIVILGIVEGVTEFLPISSTGHLLIAEHLLKTHEPDIFNVVIQAGAILAVVFIYWHKIVTLFGNLDQAESRNYLLKVLLAFITTTVLVLIFAVKLKLKLPESLVPVAWATFIGGLVIYLIEAFAKHLYPHEDVSWFEAVLVGAGQVLAALFPGASRSGSTIMAGLAVGMKRTSVTEFSFLVGIPTMFAASAFDIVKNRKDLHDTGHQLILDTALGFVISLIVAFFVVKWLLRFVQSHTFNGFATYRVLLGGGLLMGLYTHAIPDVTNEEPKAAVTPVPMVAPAAAPMPAPAPDTNVPPPAAVPPSVPTSNTDSIPVVPSPTPNPAPAPAPATPTSIDQPISPAPSSNVTEPVSPRALPVNPADLTNADSSTAPPAATPATNAVPANVPAQ